MQNLLLCRAKFIIILIGLIVYFNSLFNGFVWDDETQIIGNGLVHSIANLSTFFTGSTFGTGGTGGLGGIYYKPVMTTGFSLIYSIFGQNAFFFHLFQVLMHIANVLLLFAILKRFFKEELALVLSIVFLVHPFNVESVVYISALQDILFSFFGLLALYFVTGKEENKTALVVLALLLLSLLSKETGIVFFVITLFYVLLFQKERILKYFTGSAGLLGIYFLLRLGVAQVPFTTQHLSPITRVDLLTRFTTLPKVLYFYISNIISPKDLAVAQQWVVEKINFQDFYLPLIIDALFFLIVLSGLVLLMKKYNFTKTTKTYLFFVFWFLAGLGLHLQIFPLDMTVADRWVYAPMMGILGMVAGVIPAKAGIYYRSRIKFVMTILVVLLIVALSARSIARNSQWKDGLTLFSNDVKISKEAFDLENNLGVELFRAGKFEEAETHFRKSTELAPFWWSNWNGLGAIYERRGDIDNAIVSYQTAVNNGTDSLAYENLANLLFLKRGAKTSREFILQAISKLPYNGRLWLLLALSEYELKNNEQALNAAKQAYLLSPNDQSYYVYSNILQGRSIDIKR